MSCEESFSEFIEDLEITKVELNELLLSENLNYGQLQKIVDSQKMYFINNSGEDSVFLYELSLDYSNPNHNLNTENVFLRAERFAYLGFRGHIAATIDGTHIVALENGGSTTAVINLQTKEVVTYEKPDASITQVGFNLDGELYAAGGDKFYHVENWANASGAEFKSLKYEGLPKISGGDLLFLNDSERPMSFLSFSRGNNDNDGDGAYFIDVVDTDADGNPTKVNYQRLFKLAPKVTGACVIGENHFATTHANLDKAIIYSPDGTELFRLNIKTSDGKAFVAGNGDLASVNNLKKDFFESHIQDGVIYLSSVEENKIYKLDLNDGNHDEIKAWDYKTNPHIGLSGTTLFYTNKGTEGVQKGLYAWNMETETDTLLRANLSGEKVVHFNNQVLVMGGNNLRIFDIASNKIIHSQRFSEIGVGGDLLISKDQKDLLVFDRKNKQVWNINLTDYSLTGPILLPVQEANGAAFNEDGTLIVASKGHLYILDDNYELIGEKLLGFIQNNGDMASSYFNF